MCIRDRYYTPIKPTFSKINKIRFFKPLTSYIFSVKNTYVLFNLYYKTSLETFQQLNSVKKKQVRIINGELYNQLNVQRLFFL